MWLLLSTINDLIKTILCHYMRVVPSDLSYLPEHQALPSIFEFLKEEANAAGKS